jgi:hypothetical protein
MRFALLEAKLGMAKALRLVEIQRCEKTEVSDNHFIIHEFLLILKTRFHFN